MSLDHAHTPIDAIVAAVKIALTPTVEIEVRDGKVMVMRKDRGLRLIITDYDQHSEGAIDTFEDWESIGNG